MGIPKVSIKADVEADRVRHNLAAMPNFHTTVTREVLKAILLKGDQISCRGELCEVKNKHVGAGVYKVWTEPWKG